MSADDAGTPDGNPVNGAGEEEGDGEDSDDDLSRRIKAEAADLNTDTALAKEDWSADTSPEAVAARVKVLESKMAGAVLGGDDDGSDDDINSPYAQLQAWIEERKDGEEGKDPKIFAVQIYKKATDLGIEKKHKTVLSVVQSLFTENIVTEIPLYAMLLTKLVTSEKHQKCLLGGIERKIGLGYPELIPSTPKILMVLYQDDLIEEEVVTQWGTHVSKKYTDRETSKRVRKASEPFLKWLEEADDDEDDDE